MNVQTLFDLDYIAFIANMSHHYSGGKYWDYTSVDNGVCYTIITDSDNYRHLLSNMWSQHVCYSNYPYYVCEDAIGDYNV